MKLDYKKKFRELYQPPTEAVTVEVPNLQFIMVDGEGDPNNSPLFEQAVEALYSVSYGIKMLPKKGVLPEGYYDYVVPPLEGLWWITDTHFDYLHRENWVWTLMIRQPEFVTEELVQDAVTQSAKKKNNSLLEKVRLEQYREGLSVQIMHLGPYADEPESVAKLTAYAREKGYELAGKHHEIYLGDPRRTEPEKLRTVLRYPVKKL